MTQSKMGELGLNHQSSKYVGNELKYVKDFLDNKKIPWPLRLEEVFAKRFGVRYAITHNSGTSVFHGCLAGAGVGPGDEVISPALTVIMDTLVTLHQNAVPVFAE